MSSCAIKLYFSKGTVTVLLPRQAIARGRFAPIILSKLRNFSQYLTEQCICMHVHQFRTHNQQVLGSWYAITSASKGVKYLHDHNAAVQHPVLTCCTCIATSCFHRSHHAVQGQLVNTYIIYTRKCTHACQACIHNYSHALPICTNYKNLYGLLISNSSALLLL